MSKSIKVLIVEDESAISMAVSEKINEVGWQSITAVNGEEGLFMYEKEKPDIILLDLIMPVMDGITMLEKLKEMNNRIPVIIFSNVEDQTKVAKTLELGSYYYMVKSDCSLDDIIKQIEKVVK